MKKVLLLVLTAVSLIFLTSCSSSQKSVKGKWISFSGNKTELVREGSGEEKSKLLKFTASKSDKISFDDKNANLGGDEMTYKLDSKKRSLEIGAYTYGYRLKENQDVLVFGAVNDPENRWTTYYREGSKLEKEKQKKIAAEQKQDEESIAKLNQLWAEKTDFIDKSLREAMIGTWSGHFKSVPTTGLGVAWAPGMETVTYDKDTKVSFHASSDALTNFDSKDIHNDYTSYVINPILGFSVTDKIPEDPEKLMKIVKKLDPDSIFRHIKVIQFNYDVTTEAGTITQTFSPMNMTYKDGKLTMDNVLLITQCGDEGVQISGDIARTE